LKKVWVWSVLTVIIVISSLIQFHIWDKRIPASHSDLLPRIVGTRRALHGMNPYSPAVLRDIQTAYYGHPLPPHDKRDPQYFSYPALIIPLLAPFSHFHWSFVRMAFVWFMLAGFALSAFWWMRMVRPSGQILTYIFVIALSASSWPVVWGLRQRQPTMAIAILLAAACFSLVRRFDLLAGACMALSMVKPQIGLPLTLWLAVWSFRHRRWKFPLGFAVTLSALWAVTNTMVPGWFMEWINSLAAYTSINAPLCEMLAGKWVGLLATAVLGLWSIWILWGMLDRDSDSDGFMQAIALALAATILIVPMQPTFVYDQVLLLPAILILISSKPSGAGAVWLRRLTLICIAGEFASILISTAGEIFEPKQLVWFVLPFINQVLPIIALLALLLLAEEFKWSPFGLKQFGPRWIRRAKMTPEGMQAHRRTQ
jgi:hypothetical protein